LKEQSSSGWSIRPYLTRNGCDLPEFSPDRPAPKEIVLCGDYQQYEQLKREWVDSHPDATPEEYEQAMLALAEQEGI
jgi:hypothetical protein